MITLLEASLVTGDDADGDGETHDDDKDGETCRVHDCEFIVDTFDTLMAS